MVGMMKELGLVNCTKVHDQHLVDQFLIYVAYVTRENFQYTYNASKKCSQVITIPGLVYLLKMACYCNPTSSPSFDIKY